jgi:CRISPR-associated protein Cas2
MALTVIIAYDIADNRRRHKLATTLQYWGERVQRSVFVCTISPRDLRTLRRSIVRIIDVDADSVHIFRQCLNCQQERETLGVVDVPADLPDCWTV